MPGIFRQQMELPLWVEQSEMEFCQKMEIEGKIEGNQIKSLAFALNEVGCCCRVLNRECLKGYSATLRVNYE